MDIPQILPADFPFGRMSGMGDFRDAPFWKKTLVVALAPIVLPVGLVALAIFLAPMAVWNACWWLFYWLRFKLNGQPIPPKLPPIEITTPSPTEK